VGRFHSYINSAKAILSAYKGGEPFASFIKKYFAANKKYGSKDRKEVAHLCYCYFRTAKLPGKNITDEKILQGLFLCSSESNEILAALKPGWNDKVSLPLEGKFAVSGTEYSILNLFPWKVELSSGIEHEGFSKSFLIQPDLFIRIRPGYEKTVPQKLNNAGIAFRQVNEKCLALPNATKLEEVVELNREVVIQDYSSQRVGEFLKIVRPDGSGQVRVWDCCAASGGKSILANDILGNVDLTVSDVRESILINLKKRFENAGIKK